jgi:hypothetical protein
MARIDEKRVDELERELGAAVGRFAASALWIAFLWCLSGATLCLDGYVLVQLWTWHVTPALGVQAPSLFHAAGISMACALVTHQLPYPTPTKEPTKLEVLTRMFAMAIMALSVWFAGWSAHLAAGWWP